MNRRTVLVALGVVALLTLVGAVTWFLTGKESADVDSVDDVADLVGCAGLEYDTSAKIFITESGSCTVDGADVRVHYFAADGSAGDWAEVAGRLGGRALVGDHWAVASDDVELLIRLREDVGGEVRP